MEFIHTHEDPDLFREAITFTASQTRFLPRLIEKDYFCTVLLSYLTASEGPLVFKGGTCLAKVHAEFYRLSEDLDFAIPTPINATRTERRFLSAGVKETTARITDDLKIFRIIEPLTGANNSTQYVARIGYPSLLTRQDEIIKIEVGLREPLLTNVYNGMARTLLLNPVSGQPITPIVSIPCISREEAMAEKLRAALSRREVAIRDFYDIDYAKRKMGLNLLEPAFIELVRRKLAISGNAPIDLSQTRLETLQQQVAPQLKPVLREKDFAEFDLASAFKLVTAVATRL
ncbi:Nucleotidyl transferase AbiEii toxin, Type IV TA system [Syntrophus gentianae]|uniref:Nucleotidyl transferase AbiEii toxin, Type IV TA system n=1 Tax=Syntrophus gentianae TaxID=43775 RepID=A0A1H8A2H6_9BACT|nr:nucleotidyl transferase AbiEii/AbiGii toxin family protein [Syntrophus gentianae]SEM64048.1 Nucleotidyl transferase AbiEii toxin, Type IV TA system [Syntrophus gentianae]